MKSYYLFFALALVSCRSTSVEVGAPQDTTAQDSAASDSAVTDTLASDTNAMDSTSPDTLASDSIVTMQTCASQASGLECALEHFPDSLVYTGGNSTSAFYRTSFLIKIHKLTNTIATPTFTLYCHKISTTVSNTSSSDTSETMDTLTIEALDSTFRARYGTPLLFSAAILPQTPVELILTEETDTLWSNSNRSQSSPHISTSNQLFVDSDGFLIWSKNSYSNTSILSFSSSQLVSRTPKHTAIVAYLSSL